MTTRTARVVLVGGGLVGALSALRLADAGVDVVVIDKSAPGAEASSAAAGILAAQAEAAGPSPLFDLTLESRALHGPLAEEIRGRTGVDPGYERCGALEVARTESEARSLLAKCAWQRGRSLPVEPLDVRALRQREPALAAGFVQGVLFPDDAVLEPARLTAGVVQAAARAGVRFHRGVTARRVVIERGRARGVDTDDGLLEGDAVVLSAGAWSGAIAQGLGDPGSVRPARGQLVELEASPAPIRSVVYAHGGYLVPRGEGRVVVGSTLEFVGFRRGVTAEGMVRLLGLATKTVPTLGEALVARSWSNFRPYTDDHTPIVGMRGVEGLVLATGHYRSGILLAPITAEIVRDLVTRGHTRRAIASLSPLRAITPA